MAKKPPYPAITRCRQCPHFTLDMDAHPNDPSPYYCSLTTPSQTVRPTSSPPDWCPLEDMNATAEFLSKYDCGEIFEPPPKEPKVSMDATLLESLEVLKRENEKLASEVDYLKEELLEHEYLVRSLTDQNNEMEQIRSSVKKILSIRKESKPKPPEPEQPRKLDLDA